MSSLVTVSNFDAKKLSVSDIKKLDNGASQVYLNYDGKRLRIQAPRMPVPYNAGDYQGNQKYKVQFSFRDRANNAKVAAFQAMLEAIDNFVVEQGAKNSGKWFKMAGASTEMIRLFYSPSTKISKDRDGNDKGYPPTYSVALKMRNGAFDAEMYDASKQLMEGVTPMEVMRRGAEVTPIIDASSIWVSDKKFGISWKLHQAVVNTPGEGGVSGCLVDDDEGESVPVVAKKAVSAAEEDDLMAAVMPSKQAKAAPAPAAQEEEDDEDVEEDEIVQPPPVPAKKAPASPAPAAAPVKKVVKKVVKA